MTRLGLVVLLAGCATPRAAEQAPAAPPVAPTACPTQAPASTTFSPEGVLGARVEQVCLVGAGDETSLRLREAVAPREGSTLDAAGVRSDLGALFDTGLISQASAFAEPSGPNAVFLTYVVVERGLINRVRVEGAASLSAERRQLLDGKGFRDTVTQRNQRRALLQDFYDSSGFHDATFDLRAAGDELIITVVEGPRFVVHGVAYEGAKAVPAKDLEKVVETKVGAPVLPERLELDVMRLTALYYDRGHATVSVKSRRDVPGEPGVTDVVFAIEEGPVFKVGKVATKGLSLGADALKGLETKPGVVFSRSAIQRDLEKLKQKAKKKGLDVEVLPLTELDQQAKTIGLTFEVATAK